MIKYPILFIFNVTLAPASTLEVSVNYATGGGLATPEVDYTTASGTLRFPWATGL